MEIRFDVSIPPNIKNSQITSMKQLNEISECYWIKNNIRHTLTRNCFDYLLHPWLKRKDVRGNTRWRQLRKLYKGEGE